MKEQAYLKWMAANTETDWCNDSAMMSDIDNALKNGASGCTSNPPLSFEVLTATPEVFTDELARIPRGVNGDAKVVELIGVAAAAIDSPGENQHRNAVEEGFGDAAQGVGDPGGRDDDQGADGRRGPAHRVRHEGRAAFVGDQGRADLL